jgi:glucose dehydrogenase
MDSISLDSLSLDKISLPKLPSFKFGSDEQWPSYGKNLTNQRFSTLTQINQDNVKNLELAWKFKSGVAATFQSSPLVINNVMFISLPHNHVVALDAKTGKELWRYNHKKRDSWRMCCGPANRGLAYSSNKIFIGTVDARLVALDAKTGKKVWDILIVIAIKSI